MFQSKREKRFITTFMWHEQLGIIWDSPEPLYDCGRYYQHECEPPGFHPIWSPAHGPQLLTDRTQPHFPNILLSDSEKVKIQTKEREKYINL